MTRSAVVKKRDFFFFLKTVTGEGISSMQDTFVRFACLISFV